MHVVQVDKMPAKHVRGMFGINGFTASLDPSGMYYPSGSGADERAVAALHKKIPYIMHVPNSWYLSTKDQLWGAFVQQVGREKAMEMLPETFAFASAKDLNLLVDLQKHHPEEEIILKGHLQKRKSLQIAQVNQVSNHVRAGKYILAQRIEKCSSLLEDQVFHIRMYFIIDYSPQGVTGHIAPVGKVIYSDSPDEIITQNSVEPRAGLPRFLDELFHYGVDERQYWAAVNRIGKTALSAVRYRIRKHEIMPHQQATQLFGIDLIINEDSEVKLLEINRGPELCGTHPKDVHMKNDVFHDWISFLFRRKNQRLNWKTM